MAIAGERIALFRGELGKASALAEGPPPDDEHSVAIDTLTFAFGSLWFRRIEGTPEAALERG